MKSLGIFFGVMGSLLGAAVVLADSGTEAGSPRSRVQALHPAAETNFFRYRDIYDRSIVPEVKAKNPLNFAPIGLRYGPQTNDVAFLIFTGKKGDTQLPDEMHLYIPGHKQFNTPKAFRGRPVEIDTYTKAAFEKVAFSVESSGFTRHVQGDIYHGWGYPGYIGMNLTVTTIVGAQKASMLLHLKDEREDRGVRGEGKFRSFSWIGTPKLLLRAYGDGTQLSATVMIQGGGNLQWFLLPLEGMDKEITVTLIDDTGAGVETTRLTTTPKTFHKMEAWTGKLKNLKKDRGYTLRAKLNLGPWYGDLTAEAKTFLIPPLL
jgi:hypothetical protein